MVPDMINVIGQECEELSKALNLDDCILNKWRRDHKTYVDTNAKTNTFLEWKSPEQPDATSINLRWNMNVKIIISDTEYSYEIKDLKFHEKENDTMETSPDKDLETVCQKPTDVSEDKENEYKEGLSKINQDYEVMTRNYTSEKKKCYQQSSEIDQLHVDMAVLENEKGNAITGIQTKNIQIQQLQTDLKYNKKLQTDLKSKQSNAVSKEMKDRIKYYENVVAEFLTSDTK